MELTTKQKQREVIEHSRAIWRETYEWVVLNTTTDWIRANFNELFFYVNDRLREMTKLWHSKKIEEDIKLIKLSTLRLEITNKINKIKEDFYNEK